jgi:phosphopantetheinyl transferase (holo-ACP synthase)
LEISQYEYCKSIQNIQIKGSIIKSYSRSLLILEKLRALCQQHPDYQIKGNRLRARDYFDITKLIEKYTIKGEQESLVLECQNHISGVFAAKEVSQKLLSKITQADFVKRQEFNWEQVKGTVIGKKEEFNYYVQSVEEFIKKLK